MPAINGNAPQIPQPVNPKKKSLKYSLVENTIKSFNAGCNIVLHCNGNFNEMKIVAENSPLISTFIIKKTSQFYKILS